jgi:hypothetical protein
MTPIAYATTRVVIIGTGRRPFIANQEDLDHATNRRRSPQWSNMMRRAAGQTRPDLGQSDRFRRFPSTRNPSL